MNTFEQYYTSKFEFKDLELSLERIDNALKEANFKEEQLGNIIHIAGTNGKGSTSLFLKNMLVSSGYNTALFTSPHILKVNERINYNSKDINNDEFDSIFLKYKNTIINNKLSYFEAVFFISVLFFAGKNVDYTILETGLGGRFDATNTNMINKKLCVLTAFGYDHAAYLGNSIYSIINEKLGILRQDSHLILAYNKPFVFDYILKKINNPYTLINENMVIDDKDYPYPYNENYTTASIVYNHLLNKEYLYNPSLALPPCRMEKIGRIVLDGSHNMHGILKIRKTWKKYKFQVVLLTVTNDRDIDNTTEILKTVCSNLIVTTLPENIRSIKSCNNKNVKFIESPYNAFDYINNNFNGNILVTGSFYLCGLIKEYMKGYSNE